MSLVKSSGSVEYHRVNADAADIVKFTSSVPTPPTLSSETESGSKPKESSTPETEQSSKLSESSTQKSISDSSSNETTLSRAQKTKPDTQSGPLSSGSDSQLAAYLALGLVMGAAIDG